MLPLLLLLVVVPSPTEFRSDVPFIPLLPLAGFDEEEDEEEEGMPRCPDNPAAVVDEAWSKPLFPATLVVAPGVCMVLVVCKPLILRVAAVVVE